jgi:hypothetical protein
VSTVTPSVRDWARANGFTVADRGRLAPAVHKAYRDAFGERDRPDTGAAQCKCGRTWTGLRECHCTICHRQFSTVRWFDEHRRNMGPKHCHDPLTLTEADGVTPRYKIVDNAWGQIIVRASERPDLDADDTTLL